MRECRVRASERCVTGEKTDEEATDGLEFAFAVQHDASSQAITRHGRSLPSQVRHG